MILKKKELSDTKFKVLFLGPPFVGKTLIKTIYLDKNENFEMNLMEYTLNEQGEDKDFLLNLISQTEKIIYISSINIDINQSIKQIKMIHSLNNENLPFFAVINKIDLEDEENLISYQQQIALETATLQISLIYTSFKGNSLKATIQAIMNMIDPELRYENGIYELIILEQSFGLIQKCLDSNGLLLKSFNLDMENKSISVDYVVEKYREKKLINLINDPDGAYIFPTPKGRKFFISRMQPFIKQVFQIEKTHFEKTRNVDWFNHPIHGIIFTDDSGRRLYSYDYTENELNIILNSGRNEKFDLDLVSMFLNALQKFGEEINFIGISQFEMVAKDIRFLSLKRNNITMTVFFPSQSPLILQRTGFEDLLEQFIERNRDQIRNFLITGCIHQFDSTKSFIQDYILNLEQHLS